MEGVVKCCKWEKVEKKQYLSQKTYSLRLLFRECTNTTKGYCYVCVKVKIDRSFNLA